jgi:iron complex outermembrane receptor protein
MREMTRNVVMCTASAMALIGAPAFAQNNTGTSTRIDPSGTTTSVEAQSNAAADTQTGDIIVTATRRNERIQDVAGQVSALSGGTLERLRAKSLADFAAYTPGVSFETTSPSTNRVVIRGITTGGTQLNSAIGLYLDDVPLGSSTPFGFGVLAINLGLFDLQRVEVLNGPQGTLFGANALGGTLRYITEAPKIGDTSGRVEGEIGYTEHGDVNWAGRAVVNAAVGGSVALRLDGIVERDAGFVDDPSHGRNNLGNARILNGRASLLLQATPDVTFRVNGFAQRTRSNGVAVAFRDPTTHLATGGRYDQSYASAQPSQAELYVGSGIIDWNFHWAKLTSVTAYQDTRIQSARDFAVAYSAIISAALGPVGVQPYIVPADVRTKRITQEVRLASASNRSFEYVVGGFYSHENTFQSIQALNTADPQGKLLGFTLAQFMLPSTAREFALFGNATVFVTPELDATVGIRQSWNHQVFTSNGVGLLVNSKAPTTPVTGTGISDESVQTYLFNVRYRPTTSTLVYGKIASGYRPGGPNLILGGVGTGNSSFTSDSLWNYELGLKQNFLGGRGFFNLSGYHIDWSDIQQVRNVGGINQLVNAGNAKVDGIESLLSFRLTKRLNLLISGSYTDAKLTTVATVVGVNYVGARLPLTAKFSAALAVNYDFDLSDDVASNVNFAFRHIGKRQAGYAGSVITPLYELGSYNIVDLTFSFRTKSGWEVGPYIKNVFDTRGEVSASTTFNQYVPTTPVAVTLSQPRTFGLVVGRSF